MFASEAELGIPNRAVEGRSSDGAMACVMDPCTRVFLYLRSSVCAKAPSVRSEAEAGKRAERGSGQVAGSGAWSSLTTSACAAAAEGARLILRSKKYSEAAASRIPAQ